MTDQAPISRDMALRVGLAARALPEVSAAQLLGVLNTAIGLPLREGRLRKLTPKQLKEAGEGILDEVDGPSLKAAIVQLQGEAKVDPDLPEIEAYTDGEIADSIRVAIASNGGEKADGHFGSCARFLVYQVSAGERRLIDIRSTGDCPEDADKNAWRAGLINDCQLLYVASVGGPAAAKVVRAGIHPIKPAANTAHGPAPELLDALQVTLSGNIPPWLAKAMGHDAENRIRFERDEAEA
ncbi:MAG: dinitrogenase iron-molybdenum cofactor biosynthesis protein [Gammaproteobacteria bacterium]